MGKWLIRKPEPFGIQGICVTCETRPQRTSRDGFKAQCAKCYKERFGTGLKKPYQSVKQKLHRSLKKTFCEFCGFISVHSCQLDLDHIDGNNQNYDSENLQTLCANCHRLKTYTNQDWTP